MATAVTQPSSLSINPNLRAFQFSPPTSKNACVGDAAALLTPRQVPDLFEGRDPYINAGFKAYFCPSEPDYFLDPESLFSRVQQPHEKTRDSIAWLQELSRRLPGVDKETLRCVVSGLRSSLKARVLQHQPTSF